MGLATHNYESTNGCLPPQYGTVIVPATGSAGINDASPQALILPYVEQASKYNQFNFNYRTWDDGPVHDYAFNAIPTAVSSPGINLAARSQDIPFYLCPSDPSDTRRASDDSNLANGAQGRLNYYGSFGTTSTGLFGWPAAGPGAGIFALTAVPALKQVLKGATIVSISDGMSNTALFAEVMRTTHPWPAVTNVRDNTVIILHASVNTASDTDGRAIPSCAAGGQPWTSSIKYVGTQFERVLWGTTFYTHTLPPNWNKLTDAAAQKYNCGDTQIQHFHVAASSYHQGGVNVCMADGSVRFVRDDINFAAWQAMGSRANGDVVNDN
jgi:prepilin-type processing-associated H-X9-DG protein